MDVRRNQTAAARRARDPGTGVMYLYGEHCNSLNRQALRGFVAADSWRLQWPGLPLKQRAK